jgi:hypothetical protein
MRILALSAMLALSACQHAPEARVQTVEVKVPVAVQPITKDQIPALPRALGPRPGNASDAADVALAGRCEAIAFVIRAYPLLLLSAGLPPAQAPKYPECEK